MEKDKQLSPELLQRRVLTEVNHFREALQVYGFIPEHVHQAVDVNLETAVGEIALPALVTDIFQPVAELADEDGELRRTYVWKGMGAVAVAESGYDFHFSEPAFKRIPIEKREAKRSGEQQPGVSQSFISPKMSPKDASHELAKQEHLADEDSIRTGTAIIDGQGNIIGRRLRSLLVRDVPLEAWVTMLKDSNNIFGRKFDIADEESALSVMELFDQLDLPDAMLPEGPVTLVAEVMNYVDDPLARLSVEQQLQAFRTDQDRYRAEARTIKAEWRQFEIALAESLEAEQATDEIVNFIVTLQKQWPTDMRNLLELHKQPGAAYKMTEVLATQLELAKQKLLGREAKIMTEAPEVAALIGSAKAKAMKREIEEVRLNRSLGLVAASSKQADLNRRMAGLQIKTGGGCMGDNNAEFDTNNPFGSSDLFSNAFDLDNSKSDSKIGEEKEGFCRIGYCPNERKKTKVGGCDICLTSCQPMFDEGMNDREISEFYRLQAEMDSEIEEYEAGEKTLAEALGLIAVEKEPAHA